MSLDNLVRYGPPLLILLLTGVAWWRASAIPETGHLGDEKWERGRILRRKPASPLPILLTPHDRREGSGTSIACSGGGIRAAAFTLGGLQRLQDPDSAPGKHDIYQGCERVYGVSGGSYIATAMHVAHRHSGPVGDGPPLFAPRSPEADWLRRKSTYLLPSRKAWFRGLYSVAYGLAVNLAMVAAALLLIAAYTVWVLRAAHALPTGLNGVYATAKPWRFPAVDWPNIVPWVATAALVLGIGWLLVAKTVSKFTRNELSTLMYTTIGLSGALLSFTMLVAAPALIVVAHNAATSNQPTTQFAGVIKGVGLVSDSACERAIAFQFAREARLTWLRSPAPEEADSLPFSYGACGSEFHDDVLVFPQLGQTGVPPKVKCLGPTEPASGYAAPLPDYCSPARDTTGGWGARLLSFLVLVTALTTVIRGMTTQSDTDGGSRLGRLSRLLRHYVVPWIALMLALVGAALAELRSLRHFLADPDALDDTWLRIPVAWAPIIVFIVLRIISDAMVSSLHPFYRERLAETFFVKRVDDQIKSVTSHSDLNVEPPLHPRSRQSLAVLCVANIQDVDYVPAQRGCVTFRFDTSSPMRTGSSSQRAYIGITDERLPRIAQDRLTADKYSLAADPERKDTTLAAAVAASGAAFSPIVGRMSRRLRPYRILLTLANARLGIWLPNPYLVAVRDEPRARRLLNPGAFRILKEAFGRQTIYDSYLYVTDGGHFDNTGIVEALRDRPRQLIVLDASADAADSLDALADAITTARMDLNLLIRAVPGDSHRMVLTPRPTDENPDPRPVRPWARLRATSLTPGDLYVCDIYFVKNVLSEGWDIELDAYRRDHPEFPITTTVNQFYGEYDFEAYRQLGWRNVDKMLKG